MKEVYIDGVKYVPAKEVVVHSEKFIEALIAQYWGTPVTKAAHEYMENLRILVSDGLSEDEGESFKEFIERLGTL